MHFGNQNIIQKSNGHILEIKKSLQKTKWTNFGNSKITLDVKRTNFGNQKYHLRNHQRDKFWKLKVSFQKSNGQILETKKSFQKSKGQILEIKKIILEIKQTNSGKFKSHFGLIKRTYFGNEKIISEIKRTNFGNQKIISEIKRIKFGNQKNHFRNQMNKFWKSKRDFKNQMDEFWKSKINCEIKQTNCRNQKSLQKSKGQIVEIKKSLSKSKGQLLEIKKSFHKSNRRSKIKTNNYSCAVKRMSYKMGSVSSFWCHICACKFMLAYIYHALFRVGGGQGII